MGAPEQYWKNQSAAFFSALARRPKGQVIAGCLLATLALSVGEYYLSDELSLVVFYAIPVVAMAWLVDRRWGYAQAFITVSLLLLVNAMSGRHFSHPWSPFLYVGYRLIFYVFLIEILTRLKFLQQNLESLAKSRAQALAMEAARSLRLERDMLEAAEREQRRIGQDLHDGLCQHLTGTALASQVLVERLGADRAAQSEARRIVTLVEDGITLARDIAKGLYPIELRSDGLMEALEGFAANTSHLFGIDCRFECDLPVFVDNPSTAAHLYRIAQEAVSNAVRHGRATEIKLLLEESESGIRLRIADNGAGLPDPFPTHGGMGLRTMADRAKSIGGQFSIKTGLLGGAEVVCVAPAGWLT